MSARSSPRADRANQAPLPDRHARLLEELSRWMDTRFRIPILGWRFGLDPLIGLIPGFGDTATSLVSLYILVAASRYGLPRITLARMALNIGIDYLFGSLPIIGDAFDVYWKANHRNMHLLRRSIRPGQTPRKLALRDWLFVGGMLLLLILIGIASVAVAIYLVARVWQLLAR